MMEKLKEKLDLKQEASFSNLLEKDQEKAIKELAERMKDVVYINAEKNARKVLTETDPKLNDDPISISYKIEITGSDIKQIVGRRKRGEKDG